MIICLDIEADALENPKNIWVIVCKDITTNQYHIFREVTSNEQEKQRFLDFVSQADKLVGHNLVGYDYPVMHSLLGLDIQDVGTSCCDTLILSKLIDYPRQGHSIEDYGLELGFEKIKFYDFSKYSKEMEEYCIRDVDICHKVYQKYLKYISKPEHQPSIELEHRFQLVCNQLHDNGFAFNVDKAEKLLDKVSKELDMLDKDILKEFPPRLKLVREINPKLTKHGTLSRTDFRWVKDGDLSIYNGGPFCRCAWQEFNPSSHKQLIEVLSQAGWNPTDKTQTHIDLEREINQLKRLKKSDKTLDLKLSECYSKLNNLKTYGWKINENNLATLPDCAPSSAKSLANRILLESRRRTLVEWLELVDRQDDRIHGKFYGIGAWTHRMAHQHPNTANIPTDAKLFGGEMRSLWRAPRNRLLVGVDAEGIQLRIFAHYINDPEFTDALVRGSKAEKTDPHSLNQRIIGSVCQSRQTAKRFIYALLLGAGISKLSSILECSTAETEEALDRLLQRYTGWAYLKETVFPKDAARGYLIGLDGRKVRIPGDTPSNRRHLAMSGYLQCGEAIVMKKACLKWSDKLKEDKSLLVDFVHDEWQTETPNNMEVAIRIAKMQADSLREVGEELNLNCPLAGSYWNEDIKDYTIGTNWKVTH